MTTQSSARRSLLGRALGVLSLGALFSTSSQANPAQAKAGSYRVVFQVSDADPKKWQLTLNNIRNLQEELGAANVTVELVAFGPGVAMLKADSEVAARVGETLAAGVGVFACENTMRAQKLAHEAMVSKVGFVPAGIAALVKRQSEGYAYIRS